MDWDWAFVAEILPTLIEGVKITILATVLGYALAVVLGLGLALLRRTRHRWLARITGFVIEFIRGTPLLVVLFITYFALPALFGYHTTAYRAAVLGFVLFIGAYLAEDFRSGLRAVRPTLIQAGLATGLTRWQVLRFIILPQAIRRVLPSLFNQYVRLIKFTSVASVIGVTELTGAGLLVNAREFQPVTILASIAVVYLVVCMLLSLAGRALYARFAVRT